MRIHLLTGKVHTGKTGKLMLWIYKRPDARGVLAPVIDGKRYLMNVRTKTARLLDTNKQNKQSVTVGPHRFSTDTFQWGQKILRAAFEENAPWIIADEIGPLELKNKGLEPAVSEILKKGQSKNEMNLVLVVRDSLVEKVLKHFGLNKDAIQSFSFPIEE